jgi:hypothetical protein
MTSSEISKAQATAKAGKVPTLIKLRNDRILETARLNLSSAQGDILAAKASQIKINRISDTLVKVEAMTATEFKSFRKRI